MSTADELFQVALSLNDRGRPIEALAKFEAAAELGHAGACRALAAALATGQFTAYDPTAARARLTTGADAGDTLCALHLSAFEAAGVGGAASWSAAIARLADLAERDDRFALRELGLLHALVHDPSRAGANLVAAALDRQGRSGDGLAKALLSRGLSARDDFDADQKAGLAVPRALAERLPLHLLSAGVAFSAVDCRAGLAIAPDLAARLSEIRPPPMTALCAAPRIETAAAAVADVVCDYLILSCAPLLRPARILDPATGAMREDPYRTGATATFGPMAETPSIVAVRQHLCAAVGVPLSRAEPLSVIAYAPGQEYRPHYDAFVEDGVEGQDQAGELSRGGQRTQTVLLNLNEAYEGGATAFPTLDVRIAPRRGQAIVFANVTDSGERDLNALHCGEPVRSGVKLLASQWIRERDYRLA